jgi:hypothetical protein
VSDSRPLETQTAATADDPDPPSAGTMNEPDQAPLALTGARRTTPSVGAVTLTKSVFGESRSPGLQPAPLTCTTVPGGPACGASANGVIAASAAGGA